MRVHSGGCQGRAPSPLTANSNFSHASGNAHSAKRMSSASSIVSARCSSGTGLTARSGSAESNAYRGRFWALGWRVRRPSRRTAMSHDLSRVRLRDNTSTLRRSSPSSSNGLNRSAQIFGWKLPSPGAWTSTITFSSNEQSRDCWASPAWI